MGVSPSSCASSAPLAIAIVAIKQQMEWRKS
jgi:hypothetical protein